MRKIIAAGIELTINNEGEILRMGGPWIGDVSVGHKLLSKACLVDNFVYNKDLNLLFFVKYHSISNYIWYFTINYYSLLTKTVYEFKREFDMVYLTQFISKNELEIFLSFSSNIGDHIIFNLDNEDFYLPT